MAKIKKKSEKISTLYDFFQKYGEVDRYSGKNVDSALDLRCKLVGYQYSEIFRSLMCLYFCGGSYIEDVSAYLLPYQYQHSRFYKNAPKLFVISSCTK